MADHTRKQGDTDPDIIFVLTDKNGPVDLTNAAQVDLKLKHDSDPLIILEDCTILDATEGLCVYEVEPIDAELLVADTYKAEVLVTATSGDETTFPRKGTREILVEPRLS